MHFSKKLIFTVLPVSLLCVFLLCSCGNGGSPAVTEPNTAAARSTVKEEESTASNDLVQTKKSGPGVPSAISFTDENGSVKTSTDPEKALAAVEIINKLSPAEKPGVPVRSLGKFTLSYEKASVVFECFEGGIFTSSGKWYRAPESDLQALLALISDK